MLTEPPDPGEYAVHVYDVRAGRRLVAAIKIVSPANKDRAEHRRAFVAKCAALLTSQVCVVIVDVVTSRTANLHQELLEFLGQAGHSPVEQASTLYAVSSRWSERSDRWFLKQWLCPLGLNKLLPTLPLWLAADLAVPLDLEASYEETCRILRIP